MSHKVHPIGFRVGVTKSWTSERFGSEKRSVVQFFIHDIKVRQFIEQYYGRAGIAKIVMRQTKRDCEIIIFTAKSASITGKDGEKINTLKKKIFQKFNIDATITVKVVKTPELSAKIMAEYICTQIENRAPFRKVAKMVLQKIMEKNPLGVKIKISGRLGGVDIARSELYAEGRIPLQTLRADIDYFDGAAKTKYGIIGVKVWIAKSELFTKNTSQHQNV